MIKNMQEKMVLIKQNFDFEILQNEGRWNEELYGFHVKTPIIGFINNDTWELLDEYQKIKDCSDFVKFQEKHKNSKNIFCSTVCEFDVIVGINHQNEKIYKKSTIVAMGDEKNKWIKLE